MNIIIGEGIINIKRYVIYYKWILKLYLKDPRIKVALKFERICIVYHYI